MPNTFRRHRFHRADWRLDQLDREIAAQENTCRDLAHLVEMFGERICSRLEPDDQGYLRLYERYTLQLRTVCSDIAYKQAFRDCMRAQQFLRHVFCYRLLSLLSRILKILTPGKKGKG